MLGRFVDLQNQTTDHFAIFLNNICCPVVDTVFYRFAGNDLATLLQVVITPSEFFHCPVFEGVLIVEDELFPVILSKPGKSNVCHTKRPPSIKMARQHKAKAKCSELTRHLIQQAACKAFTLRSPTLRRTVLR